MLDARSQKGIFVGYDKESPSYLVFFPETNRVERVRCVKFFDNLKAGQNGHKEIIPARGPFDDEKRENVENEIQIEGVSTNTNEQIQTHEQQEQDISAEPERYPTRARNKPSYFGQDTNDNTSYTVDYCYRLESVPVNYKQALEALDAFI